MLHQYRRGDVREPGADPRRLSHCLEPVNAGTHPEAPGSFGVRCREVHAGKRGVDSAPGTDLRTTTRPKEPDPGHAASPTPLRSRTPARLAHGRERAPRRARTRARAPAAGRTRSE